MYICFTTLLYTRGRLIAHSHEYTHVKLANKSQERPSLQHELLAFSSFPGLRLFVGFVKLDQGFRMKLSPALKTHSILQTIGWSEVSSLKVMISSGFCQLLRSRTRHSSWRPFTMWSSCSSWGSLGSSLVAKVRGMSHSPIFGASCSTRKIRCQMRSQLNSRTGGKQPFHIINHW